MTQQNSNPFLNPANNDSLVGTFNQILASSFKNCQVMLPAKIITFDRTTALNTAEVQPLISLITTNNTTLSRAVIAKIPVLQLGGGGFFLNFNLKPGDLGWIIAADRDISLFIQSLSESKPATNRVHDFSDSLFLPHFMMGGTVDSGDMDGLVIQNNDGTVKIVLQNDEINITAPTINLNGDVNIEGELNVSDRTIVQGDIASGGDITAAGDITPNTPIPP